MAKDNKVAVYVTAKGGKAMTTVTQQQVEALRASGRLKGVRRVRPHFGGQA